MTQTPYTEKPLGHSLEELERMSPEQRAAAARASVPDLHQFFDGARSIEERDAPPRSRALAASLYAALGADAGARGLRERIVTDALLRAELDRDQNVYLGSLFTRTLTRATPDLAFQPATAAEAATALTWARQNGVPVALRGAGSTAMGGSVPNDGGLTLDLSRLDGIEVDAEAMVCVVGAGARLRTVHATLAARGLALTVYPSNLGGTLAGWFATGGIGMNAFGHGRVKDHVRAIDVLLPAGEHVRFHNDGRLDVPDGAGRRTVAVAESGAWFEARGYRPMQLADFAGTEGIFGVLLHLTIEVEPRPEIRAFLLSFASRDEALDVATWIVGEAGARFPRPANVKFMSGDHVRETRRVWADEDGKAWHARPAALSSGADLPWTSIVGPASLGIATGADAERNEGYLFVDFFDRAAARAFGAALADAPARAIVLGAESARFAADRFKPMQSKRLGPGLLAAEVLMPANETQRFLRAAVTLAHHAGRHLDAEIYFLADGEALVIGGYLADHRSGAFAVDLMIAPALMDLAMARHRGRPYVLGRWQAAWSRQAFGSERRAQIAAAKRGLDPAAIVNRGVALGMELRGPLGALLAATFAPSMTVIRGLFGAAAPVRALLGGFPGPAQGRGAPIGEARVPADHALHCVNCGECNSVCPIFHESKIRLPQMLTHAGEALRGGEGVAASASVLLDLCMRCGNCEEVCQAGIPHLPLYQAMQAASDNARPRDRGRHVAILAAVRGSSRYLRSFLDVRPGGYAKRAPASLPGVARYVLLRAESDAGPAATCIHCGACVSVCPTGANHEFQGGDPRLITTEQERCIGCGTCVEVCPANHANGGQTLRVFEAPTRAWFEAIEEFEGQVRR